MTSDNNPYTPPRSNVLNDETGPMAAEIDALKVSDTWKARFRAIALAGGPKLSEIKSLSKEDRRKAFGFNILAFFFGPFYYFAKGMWKRGLVLFLALGSLAVALGIALDYMGFEGLARSLAYGIAPVFAIRANIDFYKKMVLKDNGWV